MSKRLKVGATDAQEKPVTKEKDEKKPTKKRSKSSVAARAKGGDGKEEREKRGGEGKDQKDDTDGTADDEADEKSDDEEEPDDQLFDSDDDGWLEPDIHPQTLAEALPSGASVSYKAPTIDRSLVGRQILFNFNLGWTLGRVKKFHSKLFQKTYNFDVSYVDGVRPHLLTAESYGHKATLSSWVVLDFVDSA